MIAIAPSLAEEIEALRGHALVELTQLAEETGVDLAPPDPAGLSDLALGVARAVDEAVADVAGMAEALGRGSRPPPRALPGQDARRELAQELELAALGAA